MGSKMITLRPFELSDSDIDAIMSWASDDRVTRFQRRDSYTHRDQALDFLSARILPHPYYRAICLDGTVVGSISVSPCSGDGNERRASVGYRLAYDCWGKGITTAAVRVAVAEAFEKWKELERVEAIADAENVGSQRVLEKAGFRKEGLLRRYLVLKGEVRDMVMFSIVSTDFLGGLIN